jgi:hypothetical protein
MMRRASEIERASPGSVAFLDFGGRAFDQPQAIEPIRPTRALWQKVYAVALDDLASLIAPSRVVVCEGSPKVPRGSRNQSHDARCYDPIFEAEFPETRFISGGNASDVATDRFVLTEALSQVVEGVEVIRLIDRDDRSDREVADEAARGVRVLSRRNLESYLFDDEVLSELASIRGKPEKAAEIFAEKNRLICEGRGAADDLKPIRGELYNKCKAVLESVFEKGHSQRLTMVAQAAMRIRVSETRVSCS